MSIYTRLVYYCYLLYKSIRKQLIVGVISNINLFLYSMNSPGFPIYEISLNK
jgi:hypothetical protein